MGKRLSETEKAALLTDFGEWSGGYHPSEASADEVDAYIRVALPDGYGVRQARAFLEAEREPDGAPELKPLTRKAVVDELADARVRAARGAGYAVLLDHAVNREGLRFMADAALVAEFKERLSRREPRARRELLAKAESELRAPPRKRRRRG